MKTFTIEDVRLWNPCYAPERHLISGLEYTALSILERKDIKFEDRLWVIMRSELVSDKLIRLFAVWCARQVQHLMTDDRSINALDVAEKFANGLATDKELAAASAAAWAASAAAWAASAAASYAASAAASYAASAAAAVMAVRAVMAVSAVMAVRAAAWDTAQENKLREMLIAGVETGDVK